jgi:hypothetical protein
VTSADLLETLWNPHWCTFISVTSSDTTFYSELSDATEAVKHEGTYATHLSGWKKVNFYLQRDLFAYPYYSVSAEFYDSDGDAQQITLVNSTSSIATPTHIVNENSVGKLIDDQNDENYIFVGLLYKFYFSNSDVPITDSYSDTFADVNTYYSNYWKLNVQDTTYATTQNIEECQIENLFFRQIEEKPEVYPTEYGWLMLQDRGEYITDEVDLTNTHQFTLVFEVFPIKNNFNFEVIFIDEDGDEKIKVRFTDNITRVVNRSRWSYSIKAQEYTWNKVFITFCTTDETDKFNIDFYFQRLQLDSSGSAIPEKFAAEGISTNHGISGETMQIKFYKVFGFLKNVKYYKYAVNEFDIINTFGVYYYADTSDYYFQQDYYAYYYEYYNKNNVEIDDAVNA